MRCIGVVMFLQYIQTCYCLYWIACTLYVEFCRASTVYKPTKRCVVTYILTWMFARGLLKCNASPRGPKREGDTEAKRETLELR